MLQNAGFGTIPCGGGGGGGGVVANREPGTYIYIYIDMAFGMSYYWCHLWTTPRQLVQDFFHQPYHSQGRWGDSKWEVDPKITLKLHDLRFPIWILCRSPWFWAVSSFSTCWSYDGFKSIFESCIHKIYCFVAFLHLHSHHISSPLRMATAESDFLWSWLCHLIPGWQVSD